MPRLTESNFREWTKQLGDLVAVLIEQPRIFDGCSYSEVALFFGWRMSNGEPYKERVRRQMNRLKDAGAFDSSGNIIPSVGLSVVDRSKSTVDRLFSKPPSPPRVRLADLAAELRAIRESLSAILTVLDSRPAS